MNRQALSRSSHPVAQALCRVRRKVLNVTLPTPDALIKPLLWGYLAFRGLRAFLRRIFVCEPLLKASCERYGKRVRTGDAIHWIEGAGSIILGDDVKLDGKSSIKFAARFSARPTFEVGDATGIGHNCTFTIGKKISIGRHCRIAADILIFDSGGHPTDPRARMAGLPPDDDQVRPVRIEDNVWIGRRAIIFPGVTIGEGSIVSAGAVVLIDVPPYTVVAGNPARKIAMLTAAISESAEAPFEAMEPRAGH